MRWRRKLTSHVSAKMTPRRFPPPWTIEEHNDACFTVRDKGGQMLGFSISRTIIVETANRFARDLMVQEVGFAMLASWASP
jgi:hypothetical protein